MNEEIKIGYLDHVAILVKDMEVSAAWYTKVLGLTKTKLPKWDPYPIFMISNKCGVALFPAIDSDKYHDPNSKNVKIDHFAFNVDRDSFDNAMNKYRELNLEFTVKDHHYFHSIYTKDPDGHIVELTTLAVEEEEFYKK